MAEETPPQNKQSKTRILFLFGTRPEAIKLAPVIKAFSEEDDVEVRICVTAQHREMLDQVLRFFEIVPDYDLDIMRTGQDLISITEKILAGLKPILVEFTPKWVVVHGDTTTSMAGALAAFYAGCRDRYGCQRNSNSCSQKIYEVSSIHFISFLF